MRSTAKTIAAAAFGVTVASAASAAVVDFTDGVTLTQTSNTTATGSADGIGFAISSTGGRLTLNGTTGPGATGGLAGNTDGLGVGDDEIGGDQFITIVFDQEVRLTGAFFLDLFRDSGQGAEQAFVYAGTPPAAGGFIGNQVATEAFAPGGAGFGQIAFSSIGTIFSFDAGTGNDGFGIGDFALAGVSFDKLPAAAVVPLPASALLMGTALWGFGLARRRKR